MRALVIVLAVMGCAYTQNGEIQQVTIGRVASAEMSSPCMTEDFKVSGVCTWKVEHKEMSPGMGSVLGGIVGWLTACATTGACF